jgi:hypothetical protein
LWKVRLEVEVGRPGKGLLQLRKRWQWKQKEIYRDKIYFWRKPIEVDDGLNVENREKKYKMIPFSCLSIW